MNTGTENGGNSGFLFGLIAGGALGAALAIVLAPRLASELRQRVRDSAADLGHAAADGYQEVSARITGAVDAVTARGQTVRDDVADAVGRGAREIEKLAMNSKSVPRPRRS